MGWVLYVEVFINKGHNKLLTVLLVLVGLWVPAFINLSGVKNMGSVQALLYLLGPVPPGRRCPRARHPRLCRPAGKDDRTSSCTGISLISLRRSRRIPLADLGCPGLAC